MPPVVPLTAGYIGQLFLVPALIVTVAVLVLLGFSWLISSSQTPEQFLHRLDDPNTEVRWRTAADLSQVLLRDDNLAADPRFVLGLAERLKRAVEAAAPQERQLSAGLSGMTEDEIAAAHKAREDERVYIGYLMGCLSVFRVPVGVSLLADQAETKDVADPDALARRRNEALLALARLGDKTGGFSQMPNDRQFAAVAVLRDETSSADPDRAKWAAEALAMVEGQQTGKPTLRGLDRVFERLADDADVNVRKLTAFALNFWDGSPEENQRIEDVLVRLAARPPAGSDDSASLQVSYTATAALARRGSNRVSIPVLAEMLDEARLLETFHVKPPQGGPEVPDEVATRVTIMNALQTLVELRKKQPALDLSAVMPRVEALTHHSLLTLREQATKTQQALSTH